MSNLNNDVTRFFICIGILVLVSQAAVAFGEEFNLSVNIRKESNFFLFLGTFLSAAAPSTNAAISMSAPLIVPQMIFAGYFLNNS
jgi:hypothetical protein